MRWVRFYCVGGMGMAVQLGAVALLVRSLELPPVPATMLAVEAAILHNFFWHERWTWGDRAGRNGGLKRLIGFNLTAGAVSIAGNATLVHVLGGAAGLDAVAANAAAIAGLSVINYLASDRLVFRRIPDMDAGRRAPGVGATAVGVALLAIIPAPALAQTVTLAAETLQGFERQVAEAETLMSDRISGRAPFLWLSEDSRRLEEARRGGIVVEPDGPDGDLRGGRIHAWNGGMFIPGATVDDVLAVFMDFERYPEIYPEIVRSRLLEQQGGRRRLYQRLEQKQLLTVVLDTWHEAEYTQLGPDRAATWSRSTRIQEVRDAGGPDETLRPEGRDRGFLWRIHLYWRLEEREGGVFAECQSISLSRDVPRLAGWLIQPWIRRFPRDAMERSLTATRREVLRVLGNAAE